MRRVLLSSIVLLIAGCGPGRTPEAPGVSADPMVTAALNQRILSDPDLAGMNDTGAVLAMPDPLENQPPPFDRSAEESRRGRDAALQMGGSFVALPEPEAGPALAAATLLQVAQALPAARPCLAQARNAAVWSASLPPALPIAPRGHVLGAAGNDAAGCRLRAVRYIVALTLDDLLGFYAARAKAGGLSATRRRAGEAEIIQGAKGAAVWLIHARKRGDGLAEVDLVTLG